MNKKIRQFVGLLSAILAYTVVHEGAHFLYALSVGVFKKINIIGIGVQVDVYAEKMTEFQMGIFCLTGSLATVIVAYVLILVADKIGKVASPYFKACMYYITLAMLLVDPVYLIVLAGLVGGGDMNGISLLIPKGVAQGTYAVLLLLNAAVCYKHVLPKYRRFFKG